MKDPTGGSTPFQQFFAAIAGQESGGNYQAVNPRTGALGKYQILPSNIGPWSQQYLGYRVTPQQFLASPALQEKLASAVLQGYYNAYGPRGAAAAWYSGDPRKANDYTPQRRGEPSIGQYVDQVLARAGQAGGSAGARSSLPNAAVPNGPPQAQEASVVPGSLQVKPDAAGRVYNVGAPTGQPDASGRVYSTGDTGAPDSSGRVYTTGQQQAAAALGGAVGGGNNPKRDAVISLAMSFIGTPYVWGGTSPKGFDCSGLVQYVFGKNGVYLPRVSYEQANYGRRVGLDQLRPGDLVAIDNSTRQNGADHIAIWLGNGQILEAPRTGLDVRVRTIGQNERGWYGVALNY